MNNIKFAIKKSEEFLLWHKQQIDIIQVAIANRLARIDLQGHFGDHKKLIAEEPIFELRWTNGLRLYYAYLPEKNIIVLLGGTKHGQDKDIKKSCRILRRYRSGF